MGFCLGFGEGESSYPPQHPGGEWQARVPLPGPRLVGRQSEGVRVVTVALHCQLSACEGCPADRSRLPHPVRPRNRSVRSVVYFSPGLGVCGIGRHCQCVSHDWNVTLPAVSIRGGPQQLFPTLSIHNCVVRFPPYSYTANAMTCKS
jgi:hypothetical protein